MELGLIGLVGTTILTAGMSAGAGFWAGCHLSKMKAINQAPRAKPPFYLPDVLDLIEQSRRLHSNAAPYKHQMPAVVMAAVFELFRSAETLHKRISSGTFGRHDEQQSDQAIPDAAPVEPIAPGLSAAELLTLAAPDTQEDPAAAERRLATDRQQFETWQHVAFYSAELPTGQVFEHVQCNDISRDGLSFILGRRPEQDFLLVSLGKPQNLIFLSAKVANVRLLLHEGRTAYRIGCRFLNRIDPLRYRWNAEQGVIESVSAN